MGQKYELKNTAFLQVKTEIFGILMKRFSVLKKEICAEGTFLLSVKENNARIFRDFFLPDSANFVEIFRM